MPNKIVTHVKLPNPDNLTQMIDYSFSDEETKKYSPILRSEDPTTATVGSVGQRYINTSNRTEWTCLAIKSGDYIWKCHNSQVDIVTLDRIRIQTAPTKIRYRVGEVFDPTGMVIVADYSVEGTPSRTGVQVFGYKFDETPIVVGQTLVDVFYTQFGQKRTASCPITVEQTVVPLPFTENDQHFDYCGSAIAPVYSYDPELVLVTGNLYEAEVGTYTTSFTLVNSGASKWEDGTTSVKTLSWSIDKATLSYTIDKTNFQLKYNDKTQYKNYIHLPDSYDFDTERGYFEAGTQDPTQCMLVVDSLDPTTHAIPYRVYIYYDTSTPGTHLDYQINFVNSRHYKDFTITLSIDIIEDDPGLIYGVRWSGDLTTTKLERIEASRDFVDPVSYLGSSPAVPYSSPFDDCLPWKKIAPTKISGVDLVEIPKFYYKLNSYSTNGFELRISSQKHTGFVAAPSFERTSYYPDREFLRIGRYAMGATEPSSPSATPVTGLKLNELRTKVHSYGKSGIDFCLMDFPALVTIWMLYLVEFADFDSQKCIGAGYQTDSDTAYRNGYADSMGGTNKTGTTASERMSVGPIRYRYIENLWANTNEVIDGLYKTNDYPTNMWIRRNPAATDASELYDTTKADMVSAIGGNGGLLDGAIIDSGFEGGRSLLIPICTYTVYDYEMGFCDYADSYLMGSDTNVSYILNGGYYNLMPDSIKCCGIFGMRPGVYEDFYIPDNTSGRVMTM